jgi:peptidoglycan/LPS O-acetylase OafA/YrhL
VNVPYTRSVLAGIAVSVPALYFLGFRSAGKWDVFAGNVSYGVFLNHIFAIWAIAALPLALGERFIVVALLSGVAAALSFLLVERPIQLIRRSLRTRKESRVSAATSEAQAAAPI